MTTTRDNLADLRENCRRQELVKRLDKLDTQTLLGVLLCDPANDETVDRFLSRRAAEVADSARPA